jgi:adenine phosphoribosyltransferase
LISKIPTYPDFPTPGILFYDLLPLFASPPLHNELLSALKTLFTRSFSTSSPTILLGLEARGFLFAPTLARDLELGFAPMRKKGKLPGETESVGYKKEYGGDEFEVQKSVLKGQRVVILDDVIATGTFSVSLIVGKTRRFANSDLQEELQQLRQSSSNDVEGQCLAISSS